MTELLTVNQVHEATGAPPEYIRRWIRTRHLKAEKMEGRWMIRLDDLVEFAENRNKKLAMGNAKTNNNKEHLGNEKCIR